MQPETSLKQTVSLTIGPGGSSLWGWIQYDDNLIVEYATSIEELQFNMSRLLQDFHDLSPDSYNFKIEYDLS
jgi:hypothetical protein